MLKVAGIVLLLCVALALAEPRLQQQRSVAANSASVSSNHPYLFLSVPRGRASVAVQGYHIVNEDAEEDEDDHMVYNNDDDDGRNDDDEDNEEDDDEAEPQKQFAVVIDDIEEDDDEDDETADEDGGADHLSEKPHGNGGRRPNLQSIMQNAKRTHMMVSREHAGSLMVPDGIIEIEGQSVIDEKTGKAALLVPRAALDAIPDGSVVALMEQSSDETEEERANRVVVRRRRKGSRRNVRRRGGQRRRRGGNKRRRVNKRKNVRGNRRRRPIRG